MAVLRKIVFEHGNQPVIPRVGPIREASLRLGFISLPKLVSPEDSFDYYIYLSTLDGKLLPYGRAAGDKTIDRFDYAWLSRNNAVVLASEDSKDPSLIPRDAAFQFDQQRTLQGLLIMHNPQYRNGLVHGYIGRPLYFKKKHGGPWTTDQDLEGRARALVPVYEPRR